MLDCQGQGRNEISNRKVDTESGTSAKTERDDKKQGRCYFPLL